MNKKERILGALKMIVELAVLILLVLFIVYLIKSKDGVLAKISEGNAGEKLNAAIKIFSSTDGMKLEDAIRSIEGLNHLEINEETGEYKIKIDGQDFVVFSREIIPEEEQANTLKEGGENGQKK